MIPVREGRRPGLGSAGIGAVTLRIVHWGRPDDGKRSPGMCRPGTALRRDAGGQRTVDVHVSSLRKKLELGQTVQIESIRGVGYKLVMSKKLVTPKG